MLDHKIVLCNKSMKGEKIESYRKACKCYNSLGMLPYGIA